MQGPIVVVDGVDSSPQARLLGAVPRSILAELHMFFNTNKAFLLPSVFPSIQKLRDLYAENAPGQLLVVGHADTKGATEYNDKLSLERAEATVAFLKDDVDGWLKFYGAHIESQKRWGKVEDHLMCTAMPDFVSKGSQENAIRWYQRTRGLTIDGTAGMETRRALIHEYMSLDGASLEALEAITVTAHGCGENFPLDDGGENLDPAPKDEKRDPFDRRVELFFFDNEFGITPPPPGKNSVAGSTEYPTWRQRVAEVVALRADDVDGPQVIFVELADVHFRTNSAVVLPEGQNPVAPGEQQPFTSVGVIASALRFNEGHPGRSLLVAGHTDTTADIEFNQKLSEERANVALALLKGGDDSRAQFGKLCNGRHTVSDIKQVLSWVSTAFSSVAFRCDPGVVDDNAGTLNGPVRRFQGDFNANKQALGSNADDLEIDGSVGELTWRAFFDCYEFSLQQELGETASGVATLRARLEFTDPDHEALGFSEYFPIEELGVDDFRSQTNRRVEFLFFEPDEVPNIDHAADDPETSELYLPGYYERLPLPPLSDVKTHSFDFRVHDGARNFMPGAACTLTVLDQVSSLTADSRGIVSFTLPPVCPESVLLTWTDGTNNFSQKLFVECTDGPIESVAPARLENLGYPAFADLELAVAIFQRDYGLLPPEPLGPNQKLPTGVLQELQSIWDIRLCDARLPPAASGGE